MLKLEWAHIEAFDAADLPPLGAEAIAVLGEDPQLALQPHISLLEVQYPVDDLLLAVREHDREEEESGGNRAYPIRHWVKPSRGAVEEDLSRCSGDDLHRRRIAPITRFAISEWNAKLICCSPRSKNESRSPRRSRSHSNRARSLRKNRPRKFRNGLRTGWRWAGSLNHIPIRTGYRGRIS